MNIRTIIIDDEFLARKKIKSLLEHFDFVDIVGEAKCGTEAVTTIDLKEPDLVFLDIEMPDFGGFDVLNCLDRSTKMPHVIFATAYDKYAVKAFEVYAIDYLLKPFDPKRLEEAIERVKQRIGLNDAHLANEQVFQLLATLRQDTLDYRTTFQIKEKGRLISVPTEAISMIQSFGNYLELYTESRKYLYRGTMNAVVAELAPSSFLRVHRTTTVNTHYIKKCQYLRNNEYKILLKTGQEITSGRTYRDGIVRLLNRKEIANGIGNR